MEVRAHDVPFALEHGQKIAKLEFERMAGRPEQLYGSGSVGSYYQDQTWAISRHFIPPPVVSPQQAGLPGFSEPGHRVRERLCITGSCGSGKVARAPASPRPHPNPLPAGDLCGDLGPTSSRLFGR